MKNIFDIFTSRARVLILRTLYYQKLTVPLRHVSAISNLPIFSVQNAVDSLVDEKLVTRTEEDNNVLFELNEDHPLYAILEEFFVIETTNRICLEAKLCCQKASRSLKFASEANSLMRRVKRE